MSTPVTPVSPYGPAVEGAGIAASSPYQPAPSYSGAPPTDGVYQPTAGSVPAYAQPGYVPPRFVSPPSRTNGLGVTAVVFASLAMLVALVSSGGWMQGVLFFGVPAILFGLGGILRSTKSRVSPIVALSMVGIAIVWSGVVAVIDEVERNALHDEWENEYSAPVEPVEPEPEPPAVAMSSSLDAPLPAGTTVELLGPRDVPAWQVVVSPVRWDVRPTAWEGPVHYSEVDVTITNLRNTEEWSGYVQIEYVVSSADDAREVYILDEAGDYVSPPELAPGQSSTTTRTFTLAEELRDGGVWRIAEFSEEYVVVD